ncbi:17081_t:CDS:2, partial [Acaulospora morrowiae]
EMDLHSLINHALEMVVPQVRTRVEEFHEEWKCIRKFYNAYSEKDLSKMSISSTNLPSHLENMIRRLKEEEIESRINGDLTNQHCLDYVLENNILVELLDHAQYDLPKGMNVQSTILMTFERLVKASYETNKEDTLLKQGLVQLISVVVRHINIRNELAELYFDGEKESDFRVFIILLDYVNIPGRTGKVSREALLSLINLCKGNKKFLDFLEKGVQFYEIMDHCLRVSFLALLNNDTPAADGIGGNIYKRQFSGGYLSNGSQPSEDLSGANDFKPEIVTEEFLDLWSFVNSVASIECETITLRLLDTFSGGFFKYALVSGLLNPLDDQATVVTIYVTRMIKLTRLQPMLNCILSTIFGADLDPEVALEEPNLQQDVGKTTHMQSLREILIERAGSSEDWLSLETLRLFDSILESFNQFGFYSLIFRNLVDFNSVGSQDDRNTITCKKVSSRVQRNPKAFVKHLLAIMPQEDRTSNMRHSKAVVLESVDKLSEKSIFSYEYYYLDAQRQVQMVATIRNHWLPSPPSAMKTKDNNQLPLNVNTNIRNKFFEGAFMRMIFEQLENFLEAPLERNLIITSILNKLASIVDERVDWLLYGEIDLDPDNPHHSQFQQSREKRKNLVKILEMVASEAEKSSASIPNFQTRIQLAKRRGMNSSRRMSLRRGSSVDLDSTPMSPVSPTSPNSFNASPTSAQYRDINVNPFAKFTNFVNAFIVLQEFCKELAAIVYVKYMDSDSDSSTSIAEEEEEKGETEEVVKTNYRKNHYYNRRHAKQKSMSFLDNLETNQNNRLSDSTKDDIALMRNGEKFARLVALIERQQGHAQALKHSYH